MKRGLRGLLVLLIALAIAAFAVASASATPSGIEYDNAITVETPPDGGGVLGVINTQSTSGGLPFTGMELGLIVAGGAGLIAAGLALRRFGRRSES
jgi:hypothetical protein